MASFLHLVDEKVDAFLKDQAIFKQACAQAFTQADVNKDGKLERPEAAGCVTSILQKVRSALKEYGIPISEVSKSDVENLFDAADIDHSSTLSSGEFEEFYAKVLKYAACKAAAGIGKRYGIAIVAGIVGVAITRRLPIVGALVGLFPTAVAGPGLGIAVAYGTQHGDFQKLKSHLFSKPKEAVAVEEKPASKAVAAEEKPASKAAAAEEKPVAKAVVAEAKPAPKAAVVEEKPVAKAAVAEEKPAEKAVVAEEKPAASIAGTAAAAATSIHATATSAAAVASAKVQALAAAVTGAVSETVAGVKEEPKVEVEAAEEAEASEVHS